MRWALPMALVLASVGMGVLFGQEKEIAIKEAPVLETINQKGSYLIGHNIGSQFRSEGLEIDVAALVAGLKEAIEGKKVALAPKEIEATMKQFTENAKAAAAEKRKNQGAKNQAEADKFLANNGKNDGIVTTKSGLQYQVVAEGTGPMPKATDKVRTHYKGTLIDGTVFDSSYDRGEPAEFPVGGVIKGWVEALQLMKVGSKWKLFIPPGLAYGERGAGEDIGPNSLLIFEIELLEIVE